MEVPKYDSTNPGPKTKRFLRTFGIVAMTLLVVSALYNAYDIFVNHNKNFLPISQLILDAFLFIYFYFMTVRPNKIEN